MLTQLSVKNFRGFESLEISGLKRLNLFTGLNGAGKTSILEIPFLVGGAGNSLAVFTLNYLRRDPRLLAQSDEPFRDLFFERNTSRKIELRATGDFRKSKAKSKRRLVISAIASGAVTNSREDTTLEGLSLSFEGPGGKAISKVMWESVYEASQVGSEPQLGVRLRADSNAVKQDEIYGIFASPYKQDLVDQAHDQLVKLVKDNAVEPLVECLTTIEPRLKKLNPLSENGRKNIYADLGQGKQLPCHLLGAGFFNFLNVALDIFSLKNGILIIDEIENGLHYSIQQRYFQFIIESALKRNIQLFIATHSREAMYFLSEACKELKFDDLALFKIKRGRQKALFATYDFETFSDSFQLHLDLRGE
jgi:hypothetical protein